MTRSRRAAATVGRFLAGIVAPIRPEPGTTEGAVLFGLALIAAGFLVAEALRSLAYAPLALLVPGVTLVLLGALPALRKP